MTGRPCPLLLSLLLVAPAFGQTTAEQGTPPQKNDEAGVQIFKSPMVLKLPIGKASDLLSRRPITLKDMSNFRCEGVSITRVDLKAKKRGNGSAELFVGATTWTVPGHDKWVHILTEVMAGDEVIVTDEIADLKSEEHSAGRGSIYIQIPDARPLDESELILRLTVTATDECCPPRLRPASRGPRPIDLGWRP